LSDSEVFDVTIIGGGPVGLFGCYYAGLRQMKTKIIDSLPQLGGQLTALYPEKYIYDVPGFPEILSKDLAAQFERQALQYGATVCLEEQVTNLIPGEVIRLETDKGIHLSKTVVIAAGVGAFSPKKMKAPGLETFEGRGVAYSVLNKSIYHNQRVLIVGGGDSAVDWALNLEDTAKKITLIHRRDAFRAHEDSVEKLMASSCDVKVFYELREVKGREWVESAAVYNNQMKETEEIEADAVLLMLGFNANLGPIKEWGLEISKNSIVVSPRMETNIPGVYAAGDVAEFPGKLKLIATGTSDAAIAVNYAKTYIDPSAGAFPGHSSEIVPSGKDRPAAE
jgi:thioredoxin reductase (NADPH)